MRRLLLVLLLLPLLCGAARVERYEMCFDRSDVEAAARMMLGEAGCCTDFDKAACLVTACNRADRYGGTVESQIAAEGQYLGYSEDLPVLDEYAALAIDVLVRWSLARQGLDVPLELPGDYLWFSAAADGSCNVFRDTFWFGNETNYVRGDKNGH